MLECQQCQSRGEGRVPHVSVKTSLFMSETEQLIGSNLDLIGKIDMLEIEEMERRRWEKTNDAGCEAMEEFMATVK